MIDKEEIKNLDEIFAKRFENECKKNDAEIDHMNADDILCDILSQLGFVKVIESLMNWRNGMPEEELKEKIEKLEKRAEELEKEVDKLKAIELANLYNNLVQLQSQASWSWVTSMTGSANGYDAVQGCPKNPFLT